MKYRIFRTETWLINYKIKTVLLLWQMVSDNVCRFIKSSFIDRETIDYHNHRRK
jgi:hypothetical protein